jgi:PEP-utilising enzyme, mobile domain
MFGSLAVSVPRRFRGIDRLSGGAGRRVVALSPPAGAANPSPVAAGETPRQLVGQPDAPGLATGRVRRVRGVADLARFHAREVLVCDAIQPTMTHLVPLAAAVVERRGGMLIHGAIIARAGHSVRQRHRGCGRDPGGRGSGDRDGHLGIVTVGEPEFDLERHAAGAPAGGIR